MQRMTPSGMYGIRPMATVADEQVKRMGLEVSSKPPTSLTEFGDIPVFPDKGFSNNPATTPWRPDMSEFDKTLKSILSN